MAAAKSLLARSFSAEDTFFLDESSSFVSSSHRCQLGEQSSVSSVSPSSAALTLEGVDPS